MREHGNTCFSIQGPRDLEKLWASAMGLGKIIGIGCGLGKIPGLPSAWREGGLNLWVSGIPRREDMKHIKNRDRGITNE